MRRTALLSIVICCLLSRVSSQCNISDALETEDKEFPDLFANYTDGYQLSTEFAIKKERETVFVNEYYNILDKVGKLEIYKYKDFKQFIYFQETNEAFTISGSNCETGTLENAPPFLEDSPRRWLDYEDDVTLLGPSAVIRQGFTAWKSNKTLVKYMGNIEEDRGIILDKWKQCVEGATIEYYFADPTWHNAYGFPKMAIPVRVKYMKGEKQQTLEFFNYQTYLSQLEETFKVPEGYGCTRTTENQEDIPNLGANNHLLRGEMIYHSIDMEAKTYSNFISTFEIAYHSRSDMLSYKYAPWKKGSTNKGGTTDTKPFTQTIWDNRNRFLYELNFKTWECQPSANPDYFPGFDLPGENEGSINLLDPNILISTEGFKYLGDKTERGIPVWIFEKEVKGMFLGYDKELAPVGVITRTYSTDVVTINTGNKEKGSPVRITISWYDDEEKKKLSGVLVVNIFSYSNDIPFIQDYFNVRMCFRNYDASMWFKMTFPNMGVTKSALLAHSKQIGSEFIGVLLQNTETTPVRVPRVLVDIAEEEFSIEALILERPPYQLEFQFRNNSEIPNWSASYGMLSETECLKKCVDYGQETGEICRAASYCGATCFVSTTDKPEAADNEECKLYDRTVISQSVPSMDDLVRSIRKLAVSDQFAMSFPINVGDQVNTVTFKANSFGDSYGDTRERLVSRLFREEKFQISFPGMKIKKDDKEQSKPSARYSLADCMTVCLNDPYCETLSFCRQKECLISESYISDISIESMVEDRKCIILARNYLQQYKAFPGVVLRRSAKNVLTAKNPGSCAQQCTKQTNFDCRSFDYCGDDNKCLLHTTHYIELKEKTEGVDVKDNCAHYSKLYVYDFKVISNRRSVGESELNVQHNTVEDCASECKENAGFVCTAFDFCESVDVIDNKCFLISTAPDDIKTVDMKNCRHYVNKDVKVIKKSEKRYSNGLAGGLGFLFFLIGAAIGVGATYFFAFRYANKG